MTATQTRPNPVRHGSVRLGGSVMSVIEALDLLERGLACPVSITSDTRQGPVTQTYSLTICRDGDYRADSYRLIADNELGEMYDVTLDGRVCDCADATYRSADCKHCRAIRALRARYSEVMC
jgi:hypothetical protein